MNIPNQTQGNVKRDKLHDLLGDVKLLDFRT